MVLLIPGRMDVEAVGLEPTLHYALIYSQLPSQFGHTSIHTTNELVWHYTRWDSNPH